MTGCTAAGNELARAAGAKKFVGELGSNAANIVCADADLADAATRIAGAGFEASGQQCISAQRVIVERAGLRALPRSVRRRRQEAQGRRPRGRRNRRGADGEQRRPPTASQPMVEDAVGKGAKLVLKPERRRLHSRPRDRRRGAAGSAADARGGVRSGRGGADVADVDAALELANSSEFGLQGACFTTSLETAFKVSRKLRSARSGSTMPAASASTPIRSAASARAASAAKACATPWKSCRSGSSPACGSTHSDQDMTAIGLIGCGGMAQDVVAALRADDAARGSAHCRCARPARSQRGGTGEALRTGHRRSAR